MNTLVLLPYLSNVSSWIAIVVLGIVHIILDRTKISVSEKIARDNFFQFFIDQVLHVLSIWLVAIWLSNVVDQSAYRASGIWANRALFIQLTAYVFAAFAGVPIIYYARKFWFIEVKKSNKSVDYPNFLQRVPGYFERFLATLGVVWGGWWLLLTVGTFVPRLLLKWRDDDSANTRISAIVGFVVSLLCGVIVHLFI
jgi:hypothetical protein